MIAHHVATIADALEYAHGEGVIHRDIKPHNLILGDDGRMRIADFGLARVVEEPGVTVTGEMVGSPLYMSPEQISAGPTAVDNRADIYSLGATMYEWLTLRPPHPGETREAVISKILSSDAPPLRAHNPEIPIDLETVCRKAIERNPSHRYSSAGEFRDDLQRYLDRRPIKASPAGFAERIRKYVGRHQLGSIAMVASAAILVAVVLGWALYSKQHEVDTQAAAAAEAQEEADELLDMLTMVIPGGGAAGSVIEDLVETGQVMSAVQDAEGAGGVTPENASLPPHCTPTTSSEAGQGSRRRRSSRPSRSSAIRIRAVIMSPKPRKDSSCRRSTGDDPHEAPSLPQQHPAHASSSSGASRSASSFSQPRPTIIVSPPKFGLRTRFRSVRIGIAAPGAWIATPQP